FAKIELVFGAKQDAAAADQSWCKVDHCESLSACCIARKRNVQRLAVDQRGIAHQHAAVAAEWRIGYYRYTALLAPWQQITLDPTVTEAIWDLIGRTAISA